MGPSRERVLIAITLAQVLEGALMVPEWIAIIAEDVEREWTEHLRRVINGDEDALDRHLEYEGRATRCTYLSSPVEFFTDAYTLRVEGEQDLMNERRAAIWLAHVKSLAPSASSVHTYERVGPHSACHRSSSGISCMASSSVPGPPPEAP